MHIEPAVFHGDERGDAGDGLGHGRKTVDGVIPQRLARAHVLIPGLQRAQRLPALPHQQLRAGDAAGGKVLLQSGAQRPVQFFGVQFPHTSSSRRFAVSL